MSLAHLPFFCLMMTFASLWIHKSMWLWGSFLALAFTLAISTNVAGLFSLLILALLFGTFWLLKTPIAGAKRHFLTVLAIALAALLQFHWVPDFHNWNVSGAFWVNFDKPLMGLFPLIFFTTLCQTKDDWIKVGLKAVPLTLIVIFALATLALASGAVSWQIKLPCHFILRILTNLFLVVIPEEAFFRGFLQREMIHQMGPRLLARTTGVIGSALVFTLFHLNWHASPLLLAFVCLAGILYGAIYEWTRLIEGSILCHFSINFLHMLLFTYHAD